MPVSIRRFLDRSPEKRSEALFRMVQLLLEGMRIHAVEGDKSELLKFRSDIENVEKRIHKDTEPSEVLVLAGSVMKALEDYNRGTTRLLRRRSLQLQEIVAMLTNTLRKLSGETNRSAKNLKEIERQLKRSSELADISGLKSNLAECLRKVQHESTRTKQETGKMITDLNEALKKTDIAPKPADNRPDTDKLDPLTGLPERVAAESALETAVNSGQNTFAVLFVVPQAPTLNARFGYEFVDEILQHVSRHIKDGLPEKANLYRWSGACFLAILEYSDGAGLKKALEKVAPVRLKKSLKVKNREVLMIVTVSLHILPVLEFSGLDELIRSIDWSTKAELRR